ncbi:uncharacterized protein LOC112562217 isoform X1 [Pomacea canaliculata]|uniref:uncharacterized protein LOC112562217 isoform X1 n=1 Tax=Pomacea canaliculata TaxID=400727 RepID=UPI000D729C95|nr:uncharacterized protein LOC112562217 isoform X1 [Pomacea canaliculata]
MALFILLATVLAVTVITPATAEVDSTRVPETKGSDVVDAVVDLIRSNCIFSEDRLFLRRLASVESGDGLDPKTYRAGYDGGIWQVDRQMFNTTIRCTGIQSYCNIISQPPFNITWTRVAYSDLRKPLYSGLAAALYLSQTHNSIFPADVESQAAIWSTYYRPGQPQSIFIERSANATQYDCSNPMDVGFILDSSISVNDKDFGLSLNWTANFAESMNVPYSTKLSLTTFDSSTTIRFLFDDFSTKAQVVSAIKNIIITSGGTDTALALNTVRTSVFPMARNDSKHVAILVTDGWSDSFRTTVAAAASLKKSGVVVFALGIGNYKLSELKAIASQPVCSHVFTLTDFSIINSIIYEIKRSTCQAPKVLTAPTNVSQSTTEPYTISVNTGIIGPNKTIGFDVRCGTLDIYVSFTNPRPSSALFSEHYTAEDGRPAYLTSSVLEDGRQVYITVVGKELPTSIAELQKCSNFSYTVSVVDKPWEITCCKSGVCRKCRDSDLLQQKDVYSKFCSSSNNFGYDNPCTLQALSQGRDVFPYPYDSSKFIRCDAIGNPYVTLCPSGLIFDSEALSCGNKGSDHQGATLSPYNPCTPANLRTGLFYYSDPTSKTRFIQCDEWGNAWQMPCPSTQEWNQNILTCDYPKTAAPVASYNPCTPANLKTGLFYYADPTSKKRFIQCDEWGNAFQMPCPSTQEWNQNILTCDYPKTTTPVASNPCATAVLSGKYFYPHPCNHRKYIQCDAFGKAFEMNCPSNLFYDPNILACDFEDRQPGTSC